MRPKTILLLAVLFMACRQRTTASPYTFTSLDVPGSVDASFTAINIGQFAGIARFGNSAQGFQYRGFVEGAGAFQYFDPPGNSFDVAGMNDRGQIVGNSFGANNSSAQGFLFSGGTFQPIQVQIPGHAYTELDGINNAGEILGHVADGHGAELPFLYTTETGARILLDLPGVAGGINNLGQIVGASSHTSTASVFIYERTRHSGSWSNRGRSPELTIQARSSAP